MLIEHLCNCQWNGGFQKLYFSMKYWQSQTFDVILLSWWCNRLTILICKLVIFQKVGFLLEGSRRRQDNETTTEAKQIRNRMKRNTVPHQRYYLKTLFIQAMFAQNECISSPTPWFLFIPFQAHLGAANPTTALWYWIPSLWLSASLKGTSVVAKMKVCCFMFMLIRISFFFEPSFWSKINLKLAIHI